MRDIAAMKEEPCLEENMDKISWLRALAAAISQGRTRAFAFDAVEETRRVREKIFSEER